ncbi:hypothetical protein D6D08_07959 [Aureobasidium pullulans]|nr:hypothetical protein D6D08_07959 [Aureobasidium pullulans]
MGSTPNYTNLRPLGHGPDAITHNRIVVSNMLQTPEAHSPSRWQDAADMIDEHLSNGARLDGTYLRAEDVELQEYIAAALRSMRPHQTRDSDIKVIQLLSIGRTSIAGGGFTTPMTSDETVIRGRGMIRRGDNRQGYLDKVPKRYHRRADHDRVMVYECNRYKDSVLFSAQTMTGMETSSRGKSPNELMYFDAAEEHLERSPEHEKKPASELPPPAKKSRKETEDNKLLEKCPTNHESNINTATKHKIRRLIDAPAMPIPDIGIQSATKADVWRWIILMGLTVNAPPLSTEMFIAIRFHLFMLWAKRWDLVPWKHMTEERTKLHALISMSEEASVHECLYMSVKQLEDSGPQHGDRITNPDWTFGDAVIFLPIHPLPHLLRDKRKPSAVELWKAMDYPTADTARSTRSGGVLADGRRAAIKKMCDLFLTDWTPYINGTHDATAFEFIRGSDNSYGGFWRFTVQGLCLRWLSLPREINSLAHRIHEPDSSISTFWDGTTASACDLWYDRMDRLSLAVGEFKKKCMIGYHPELDEDLRPANSQQGRQEIEDQNYENHSPPSLTGEDQDMAAASDDSMSDPINTAETLPDHTIFSGNEEAYSIPLVTEDNEVGHIQPSAQTINSDQEMAEPEGESGGITGVSSAPITETVEVEHGDPRPSPLSDTPEDVDMLEFHPNTTSSQNLNPALEEDDDRNPRGKSDELGDHDAPTTGSTPHMHSVEDMTTSTNSGEPSSEVGDIHDQPVKQENDDQDMEWTVLIPYGRWNGFGDDEVLGWI